MRCKAKNKSNGNQCSYAAIMNGYCTKHFKLNHKPFKDRKTLQKTKLNRKNKIKLILEQLELVCIECNQDDTPRCKTCPIERVKEILVK